VRRYNLDMAKNSKRTLKLDMTDVEARVLVPEGDHIATVDEVTVEVSDNSGKDYLKWKLTVKDGGTLYHNTSLQPQALFGLKNVLVSLGLAVPASVMKLDLDDLEGRQMGVTVEHEVFQGKKRPRITDVYPLESDKAIGESSDEDEEDEEEVVDLDSMTLEQLLDFAKESEISLKSIPKKDRKDPGIVRDYIRQTLDEEDDDDDL